MKISRVFRLSGDSLWSLCSLILLDTYLTLVNQDAFSLSAYLIGLLGCLIGILQAWILVRILSVHNSERRKWTVALGSIGALALLVTDLWGVCAGIVWAQFGSVFMVAISCAMAAVFEALRCFVSQKSRHFWRALRRVLTHWWGC